jgi:hypothetical protein
MTVAIQNNRTVYNTEDLQALLEAVAYVMEEGVRMGGLQKYNSYYRTDGMVDVIYGSSPLIFATCSGSKGYSVKVMSPQKLEASLAPTEALTLVQDWKLPREAILGLAVCFSEKLGYRGNGIRSGRRFAVDAKKVLRLLSEDATIEGLAVRKGSRIADPYLPKTQEERRIKAEETFRRGKNAREMNNARHAARYYLKEYAEQWATVEEQRQRLIKVGGHSEAYPTVEDLAQELLIEAKQLAKKD